MSSGKIYKSVMSFGCMCSTALFLRKNGFRSESTIFDWFSSTLQANLKLLDNDFSNLISKEYLYQPYKDFPHIVDNKFYEISLNHLFSEYQTFKKQFKKVSRFCYKRIKRFKENLRDGNALLVYYSRDKEECEWISNNESLLEEYSARFSFDWLFITNYPLKENFKYPHYVIPFNNIHKPYGGEVSFPFEKDEDIIKFLNEHYDETKKEKNLLYKPKKHFFMKVFQRFKKIGGIKLKIS